MAKLTSISWLTKNPKKTKNKASSSIGVLSFELSKLISRTIHLHSSLTTPPPSLDGLRRLVSADVASLSLAESLSSLLSLARAVTCLASSRCSDPLLRRFGDLFTELLDTGADPHSLRYSPRKMDRKLRKMKRLVSSAAILHAELEVLAELEQALKRAGRGSRIHPKVSWQRKMVRSLRAASLWNRSFDYAVRLLARSLFTIAGRLMNRTAVEPLTRSYSFTGAAVYPSDGGRKLARFSSVPLSGRKVGRSFSGCITGDSNVVKYTELNLFGDMKLSQAFIDPKRSLLNAGPDTLGASALHLHYANVIIVIEKFAASPHLIGQDARDDLYYMLTTNIRTALRTRLRPYAKILRLAVYNPVLAAEWSEAMMMILDWLSPLAHNMIKWQSERSFEQQLVVSRANVLLVQTLYFANQAKTEAAITELLVGLNYLWRFGKELNAQVTLECVGDQIFDESLNLNG